MTLQFNLMKIVENVSNFFLLYIFKAFGTEFENGKIKEICRQSHQLYRMLRETSNRFRRTFPNFRPYTNLFLLFPYQRPILNFFQQRFQTFSKALLSQLLTALPVVNSSVINRSEMGTENKKTSFRLRAFDLSLKWKNGLEQLMEQIIIMIIIIIV